MARGSTYKRVEHAAKFGGMSGAEIIAALRAIPRTPVRIELEEGEDGYVVVVVVAAIAAAFGIKYLLALTGFGVPVIWCMTIAVILLPWPSRHRKASIASLIGLAAVSIAGLFNLG